MITLWLFYTLSDGNSNDGFKVGKILQEKKKENGQCIPVFTNHSPKRSSGILDTVLLSFR